jgi:hypothetical protein
MLFDWLVVDHVLDVNPAHAVRGPKYSQKKGKTPVLDREEAGATGITDYLKATAPWPKPVRWRTTRTRAPRNFTTGAGMLRRKMSTGKVGI